MRKTVEVTAVFALATAMALAGCSERTPTGPSADGATPFFTRAPAAGYDVLRRSTPLAHDVTVVGVVGPEGGRLDVAEAGVTLVIPAGALTRPTRITMTALAGDATAVEFAPHGLEFDIPARIHVRAEGTGAEGTLWRTPNGTTLDSFLGVYFEGRAGVGAEPLETIPTFVLDGAIVFEVEHFSGYATASG